MAQSGLTISKSARFDDKFAGERFARPDIVVGGRISALLDQFVVAGLIGTMILTALAHGAVEPWSVALFEFLAALLLLAWAMKAVSGGHLEIEIPAAALPIFALLLLAVVQSIAYTNGAGQRVSLSFDVEATRHSVLILVLLAMLFVIAANVFRTRSRLILLANVLTVFGPLVAGFALIQNFTWNGRIYWFRSTPYSVFGPFVNHNHFAGYMDMLAPIPVGLMLTVVRGQARLVYGFAAALMGIASVFSGSRSGAISLAAALVFTALMSRRFRYHFEMPRWSRVAVVAVIALAISVGVVWIGATQVVEHFGQAADAVLHSGAADVGRAQIWRETMKMIADRPVLGAGLGSYGAIYPAYAENETLFGLEYSHNDYLQILADAGIIGGVLALWFIGAIFSAIYRAVRSRDPLSAGVALGAGAGIVAVLVQSLSDTDLQIPSNALLFLILAAVVSRIEKPEVVLV
jgi:O-antigen ligase